MPKGKVAFEMVMPAGMTMPGMHSGTTILGTKILHNGMATLKVKPSMVLNMPLEILYKGSAHFDPSSVTPPVVTSSSLMNSAMSSGMTM